MKKFSKRALSLFLSILMVVTMLPTFALTVSAATADPYWTRIASSNFDATTVVSNNDRNYTLSNSPVMQAGDNAMLWKGEDYNKKLSSGGTGLYVDDGYLYFKGHTGGVEATPITGKENFKIDIDLEWTAEDDNRTAQRYCLIQLASDANQTKSSAKMGDSDANVIAQDIYGKLYVGKTGYGSCDTNHAVCPKSANMKPNKRYHYIMTYANKTLKSYVTDENYVVMQDVCTVENIDINTSAINSIALGDDNKEYYLKHTMYHSITFYEGKTTAKTPVDTTKNKYVFAYFTGNDSYSNGTTEESLHFAVSDDGINWSVLNKGNAIWNGQAATDIYPSGAARGANAATGHIRDPYIFRAEDGSFYILGTDMDCKNGSWSSAEIQNQKIHVIKMDSIDSLASGQEQHWDLDVESIAPGSTHAWAPQAIWDPQAGHYMLYWSVASPTVSLISMYYVYTDDFKTFIGEPKRLISPIGAGDDGDLNNKNIDGDITFDGQFYYLWFKNEANSSLAVMSSESPSGPYTNLKNFTHSQALEGPQLYRLQDGKYALMADAFNDGDFHIFVNDKIDGFTATNDVATNVKTLTPRHGSVMQITTEEYNSLVNRFGIDPKDGVVRYHFSYGRYFQGTGWVGTRWDGNQIKYQISQGYNDSSYADIKDGVANMQGKSLFLTDDSVISVIQNPQMVITFDFEKTQNSGGNATVFAVCNPEATKKDFIRLTEDGTFMVNEKTATTKATIDLNTKHSYKVIYSGSDETAVLLQDGVAVASVSTGAMNNTTASFVGLGFSDSNSANRVYGKYSNVTLKKTVSDDEKVIIDENYHDEALDNIKAVRDSNDLDATKVSNITYETFNKPTYYRDYANDLGGSVAYQSQTTNSTGDWDNQYVRGQMKAQANTVLVYDGINDVYFPTYIKLWPAGSDKIVMKSVQYAGSAPFKFNSVWSGADYCKDDANVPATVNKPQTLDIKNVSGGSQGSVAGNEFRFATNNDWGGYNTSSGYGYFWWNKLYYTGSGNTDNYYEKYSNDQLKLKEYHRNNNWGWGDRNSDQWANSNVYVVNYKPLREILDNTKKYTVDGTQYDFHKLYTEVSNNEKKYTEESIKAYYRAVGAIKQARIQGWFDGCNDSSVEGQVQNAANQIKELVNNYNSAVAGLTRQYKITFYKNAADGGAPIRTRYVDASNAEYTTANYIKTTIAPKNTANNYDSEKHYTYRWDITSNISADTNYTEIRDGTSHTFPEDEYKNKVASTCTTTGSYTKVCSCGYEENVNTDVLGHEYSSTLNSNNDGTHYQVCQRDGCTEKTDGHIKTSSCSYIDSTSEDGTMITHTCACGYSYDTFNLDFTNYNNAVASANDCINYEGVKYVQSELDALSTLLTTIASKQTSADYDQTALDTDTQSILDAIAALHDHTKETTVINATTQDCTKAGYTGDTVCSTHNDVVISRGETITANGHNYVKTTVAPTCTEEGYDLYTCSVCKDEYKRNYSPATGHSIASKNVNVISATCTQGGTYTEITYCTNANCPLDLVAYEGEEYHIISVVDKNTEANGHTFDEIGVTQSTCTEKGFVQEQCSVCGFVDTTYSLSLAPIEVKDDTNLYLTKDGASIDFNSSNGYYSQLKGTKNEQTDYKYRVFSMDETQSISSLEVTITYDTKYFDKTVGVAAWIKMYDSNGTTLVSDTQTIGDILPTKSSNGQRTIVVNVTGNSFTLQTKQFGSGEAYVNVVGIVAHYTMPDGYTEADFIPLGHNYESEITTPSTCTTEGVRTFTCTRGDSTADGYQYTQPVAIDPNAHNYQFNVSNNGEVYTWTNVCAYNQEHKEIVKTLDFSTYNAAVTQANAKLEETEIYTEASLTALQNAVDNNQVTSADKTLESTLTVEQLEAKVTAIQTAISELKLKSYTYKVAYYDVDGNWIADDEIQEATVEYGTEVKLTADSNYSVIKWVATYEDKDIPDVKVAEIAKSIKAVIKSNVEFSVTVNDISKPVEENTYAVSLYNRTNKLADIAYIPNGNYNVSISGNTITIGTYKLVAPEVVFYDVTGFEIDGEPVTDGVVTISSNTDIKTIYKPSKNDITITCDDTCTSSVTTAYWNQRVVVTANDGNANTKWLVNDQVVAYGPTYSFIATANATITCVNEAELLPVATILSLGYGSIRAKTISAVCSYYVPEGYKFVEAGVLLKTSAVNNNAAVNNVNNYTGADGTTVNAKAFKATEFVNSTRQYVINVSSTKDYNSLYVGAVAYVVAEKDGVEKTYYSPLVISNYEKPSQNA